MLSARRAAPSAASAFVVPLGRVTQELTDFRHQPLSRERTGEEPNMCPQRRFPPRNVVDNDDGAEPRQRCENFALRLVHDEKVRRAIRSERDSRRNRRRLEEAQVRTLTQAFADVTPEIHLGGNDEHR